MGLSSVRATGDGVDWSQDLLKSAGLEISIQPAQAKQQKQPQLRCPRCDSTNTKFCYYNNYSKLQPRHFCKACRRHWTNGGTLRNVPVGGGRKAKRPKTSHPQSPTPTAFTDSPSTNNSNLLLHQQQRPPPLTMAFDGVQFPPTLIPDYCTDNGSSGSFLGSLQSLPPVSQFIGTTAAEMLSPYISTTTTTTITEPFSGEPLPFSFFNFTGQDPSEEEGAGISGSVSPWQQLVPTASSNADVGVNALSSSPSCFWSYWEDLVSPDPNQPFHPKNSPRP